MKTIEVPMPPDDPGKIPIVPEIEDIPWPSHRLCWKLYLTHGWNNLPVKSQIRIAQVCGVTEEQVTNDVSLVEFQIIRHLVALRFSAKAITEFFMRPNVKTKCRKILPQLVDRAMRMHDAANTAAIGAIQRKKKLISAYDKDGNLPPPLMLLYYAKWFCEKRVPAWMEEYAKKENFRMIGVSRARQTINMDLTKFYPIAYKIMSGYNVLLPDLVSIRHSISKARDLREAWLCNHSLRQFKFVEFNRLLMIDAGLWFEDDRYLITNNRK